MGLVIRELTTEDYPIIFNSWLKSYSKDYVKHKGVPSQIYYQGQHLLIERLLFDGTTLVAVDSEDPNIVLGYCVGTKADDTYIVHYVYVKKDFRGMGIASSILKYAGVTKNSNIVYTHYTPSGAALASKFNAIYHPYILMVGA